MGIHANVSSEYIRVRDGIAALNPDCLSLVVAARAETLAFSAPLEFLRGRHVIRKFRKGAQREAGSSTVDNRGARRRSSYCTADDDDDDDVSSRGHWRGSRDSVGIRTNRRSDDVSHRHDRARPSCREPPIPRGR